MPPSPSLHSLAESGFELGSVGLSYMFPTNTTCTPTQDPFPTWPLSQCFSSRPLLSTLLPFSLSLIHKRLGDSGKGGHGTRNCSSLVCWLSPLWASVSSLVAFPQLSLPSVPSFPHLLSIPEHLSLVGNPCLHVLLCPPFGIMPQASVYPSGSIPNPFG